MKEISSGDLRQMENKEGLILQGCGGNPREWVDGINELLTEAGILKNGSSFDIKDVALFQYDGLINLLFPFEGVDLDIGKLAIWRLQTLEQFSGVWLSDYVQNQLGGIAPDASHKPKMELVGQDGNIFSILGRASELLKQAGQVEQSREMNKRVKASANYAQALSIVSEYVQTEFSQLQIEDSKNADSRAGEKKKLFDRVDKRMNELLAEWSALPPASLIAKSSVISAVRDAYNFLTAEHGPDPDEVSLLLQCGDPLQHVAGWVEGHMGRWDELRVAFDDALDELREDLQQQAERKKPERPSALDKLREKQEAVKMSAAAHETKTRNKEAR